MINNQHEQIISDLIRLTLEGKLNWDDTGLLNEFSTKIGDYRISIYKLIDDGAFQVILPDTVCAEMTFIDKGGDTFDQITVKALKGEDFQKLSKLHDIAKRSATGADRKLDDIISILKK